MYIQIFFSCQKLQRKIFRRRYRHLPLTNALMCCMQTRSRCCLKALPEQWRRINLSWKHTMVRNSMFVMFGWQQHITTACVCVIDRVKNQQPVPYSFLLLQLCNIDQQKKIKCSLDSVYYYYLYSVYMADYLLRYLYEHAECSSSKSQKKQSKLYVTTM